MLEKHFESDFPLTVREKELGQVVSFIKDGKSCQVIGIPGVSRSTLLGMLAYSHKIREKYLGDKQDHVHFVKADFSEIRRRPLFDVMKYLFLNLTESLRERGHKEQHISVGDIFREHLQFNDELILFQGFKEAIDYLALEQEMTTVFLFDRFEEYIPDLTPEFFSNMRILRSRAKYRFVIVCSLLRPLEESLDTTLLADYFEFIAGNIVYVSISDLELTNFRLSYTRRLTGKTLSSKEMDQILVCTGGHGKLAKLAIEALIGETRFPEDVLAFLLRQKTIQRTLEDIWNALLPAEQREIQRGDYSNEHVRVYLENVGLVKAGQLQIPLFASFVAVHARSATPQNRLVYHKNTNTIQKGDAVISDQLTSSEFRLLRYLLEEKGKIIERDALVQVVWQDIKSTAGITDQAIDQLIFRLRRKIEDDPNHPAHLLTVKGRGFRLES